MIENFFWFTEEQKELGKKVSQFVEDNFEEAEEYFWNTKFPWPLVKKVAKEGYFGVGVPKKYGGLELGATGSCIAAEQLGRLYAVGHVFTVSMLAGLEQMLRFANEEQREKWLPKIASGEELGALCITEPFAGSDAANIFTTAEKDGDEWIINGKKRYITGAGVSDRYFIYAKTSDDKSLRKQYAHLTSFVVEKGRPGFSLEKVNPLIGFDNVPNGYLDFDNVRIPDENRIGEVGKGWNVMMAGLNFERLIGAAVFGGLFEDIISLIFYYTKRRVQFNRTTIQFPGIQNEIADIIAKAKLARLFSYHCAKLLDDGREPMIEASIAKMVNTEFVRDIGIKAIQVLGGDGLTKFLPVERILREAKVGEIVAGTTEIQKMIIYRFSAMLPIYNKNIRLRWNDTVNAPIISKKQSKFKGLVVNEENVLKVIAHDYKVNPGLYMTPDDVREDIGGSRSALKDVFEVLEKKNLIVCHRDRQDKVVLVKATYLGLQKAFPKEYYQWFPEWYEDSDKF
jgi:alkylation response protein AidB-like acyl-CoA dehydrogenase/DNA-binding MarR family transcriptional regulator